MAVHRRVHARSGVDLARVGRRRPAQIPGAADTRRCSRESSSRRSRGRPPRGRRGAARRVPARDRHARVRRRPRRPPRLRALLPGLGARHPADLLLRREVVRVHARWHRDRRRADRERRGPGDQVPAGACGARPRVPQDHDARPAHHDVGHPLPRGRLSVLGGRHVHVLRRGFARHRAEPHPDRGPAGLVALQRLQPAAARADPRADCWYVRLRLHGHAALAAAGSRSRRHLEP
jgi:hypothetical protein